MTTLLLALAAGAVVGLALGALGGGGGVLAVPALIYLIGLTPADAGTASLVIVLATAVVALARHAGAGGVRWRTGGVFALAGLPPAIGAALLSRHLPHAVLTGAFAVLAGVAAVAMLRPSAVPGTAAPAPDGAGRVVTAKRVSGFAAAGAGAGLGAVTGLLGVGGGFLAVPTLVTVLSMRMRYAVGTSLLVITINSAAALATRLLTGAVPLDWAVIGPFAGAAILAAWDGKRLAAKVSGAILQRVFAILLLAVAAFMAVDAVS